MSEPSETLPLTECSTGDVFATELARVERLGSVVRLTFAVMQSCEIAAGRLEVERFVIARMILPVEALAAMTRMLSSPVKSIQFICSHLSPCRTAQSQPGVGTLARLDAV